jgi:hypothetical protein
MQCLYCDRRLGLFSSAKGAFCSEEHEKLYREAARQRLEAPYVASAGALEDSAVHDLAQLLKATQAESGATVEAPLEVTMASALTEAVAVSVSNSSASTSANTVPEVGQAGIGAPIAPISSGSEQTQPLPNLTPQSDPQWSLISDPPSVEPETPTDRRAEPRIKEIKILKVATLRDPEKQVHCALVDTSDTGIQFTSDREFRTAEVLVVELPDQLALAEVRYSQAKDGRYAVGAERAQTISLDAASSASTGQERAELLIKTLCDRVKTGFAEEPGQGTDRTRALERVARILEVWQHAQSAPTPSAHETRKEAKPSTGAGRAFGAVAAALVIGGVLTVCVLQFQKDRTPLPPSARVAAAPPRAKIEPAPQVVPANPMVHRAQIRALQSTWIGISTDGNNIFGGILAKGATKDLEYSKFAFLHAGNATGVEIIVDGQPVPMGSQARLRLVELNAAGYRFLRWTNDDPPQP